MSGASTGWLTIVRGEAPLVVSVPHAGTEIPHHIEVALVSPWLARKDADWWVDQLYGFAAGLGATVVRTAMSRTVIDVNRDPSGASLYPGAPTTGLCPLTTFDGEPLWRNDLQPSADEIARRKALWFTPYHDALNHEIDRLRTRHGVVVLYDAHSIRSRVQRLFEGELANFNIGTNDAVSCDPALTAAVERACDAGGFTRVTNGRFKGGWITRHHGRPGHGVHALQMELACRGYMVEPSGAVAPDTWPSPFDPATAAPMVVALTAILQNCLEFAEARS